MIQILSQIDVLLILNIFGYYLALKLPFRHNSARKNLFLKACYIRNDKISLREMDQNLPFGGLNVYENFYLDSILCYSKDFRLHAILHDAAGAVRSHTGIGSDYCYLIEQGSMTASKPKRDS